MKPRGIHYLYAYTLFLLLIYLVSGCRATPTVSAIPPTLTQPAPTQPPIATTTSTADAGGIQQYTKYSDMRDLFTADVPSNWSQSSFWGYSPIRSIGEYPEHTPDTLEFVYTSPDQHGRLAFLEYDDNHEVAASQLGESAIQILNIFFSKGAVSLNIGLLSDSVKITANNPLPDGSVQLNWGLVQNKMVGTTNAYKRGNTIIVLSTFSDEAYSKAFSSIFAHITSAYKVP
jgi:hypothetical protein